jgi:Cu+-exporting ATPase
MKITDPVCKMTIEEGDAVATSSYRGKTYHFCSFPCKKSFDRNPESYLGAEEDDGKKEGEGFKTKTEYTCPMHPEIVRDEPGSCPKCGMALEPRTISLAEEESNPEYDAQAFHSGRHPDAPAGDYRHARFCSWRAVTRHTGHRQNL